MKYNTKGAYIHIRTRHDQRFASKGHLHLLRHRPGGLPPDRFCLRFSYKPSRPDRPRQLLSLVRLDALLERLILNLLCNLLPHTRNPAPHRIRPALLNVELESRLIQNLKKPLPPALFALLLPPALGLGQLDVCKAELARRQRPQLEQVGRGGLAEGEDAQGLEGEAGRGWHLGGEGAQGCERVAGGDGDLEVDLAHVWGGKKGENS